ncbi:hypothetical protein B0H17DRAFT_1181026 [Mycena rosella]|uniref:NmrA-like domain-containing protein n=1 Tax=Mycena rosella TaxID=1033263 RepID=A0AAD7DAB3_MYCRO|nr:hypothetical protein B0H17DRAFT_1181026 [Mycena rosella]
MWAVGSIKADPVTSKPAPGNLAVYADLKAAGIPSTRFFTGNFTEFLPWLVGFADHGKIRIVGKGEVPVSTSIGDIACPIILHDLAVTFLEVSGGVLTNPPSALTPIINVGINNQGRGKILNEFQAVLHFSAFTASKTLATGLVPTWFRPPGCCVARNGRPPQLSESNDHDSIACSTVT